MKPVQRQAGVAMALVLWFVAAMTVLVAGIVFQARVDTHFTQIHLSRAQAVAAADGAIVLALMELTGPGFARNEGVEVINAQYQIGEQAVEVQIVPAAGLVDLNVVPMEFMRDMLVQLAQLEEAEAQQLANNVIKWRESNIGVGRYNQFYTPEDLLQVPGFSRALYDRLRDGLGFTEVGSGTVRWGAAPESLLGVLSSRNEEQARGHLERREQALTNEEAKISAGSGGYRVDARLSQGDQRWQRRRWVKLGSSGVGPALWRYVRTEPGEVLSAAREGGR